MSTANSDMIVQSFLFTSKILVITKIFVFHFIRTWTIVKKIYCKYSLVEQDAPTHVPFSCRDGKANKVTSVALTRDYDNNIQQHKFPHLPAPGVCCIKFWTCLVDTSITVSSSAERGIMCDKILGPDTLNVDMGDFV